MFLYVLLTSLGTIFFLFLYAALLFCRYSKIPDNLVPLTELGWEQARQAGRRLRNEILKATASSTTVSSAAAASSPSPPPPPPPRQVHFIVSPYVRTVETFHGIVSAWCDPIEFAHIPDRDARIKAWYSKLVDMGISWAEDPRIREQVRHCVFIMSILFPPLDTPTSFGYRLCCAIFRILETCKIPRRLSNPSKNE
jgi:hypothetical protein